MNNWCNFCGVDLYKLEQTGTCLECLKKNKINPVFIVRGWWNKQTPHRKFLWEIATTVFVLIFLSMIERQYPLLGELLYNFSTCNGRFS